MEDAEKEPGVIERTVTPSELAKLIIDTLRETVYQTASVVVSTASGLEPQNPINQVREDILLIRECGERCCRQILDLEEIAQRGLRGEPIPIQSLSDPESPYFKQIIALPPTSKRM